jgi:PiT family inorganic phosphate transporter
MESILVAVVVIALVFDFTNGFHDAANAVATWASAPRSGCRP